MMIGFYELCLQKIHALQQKSPDMFQKIDYINSFPKDLPQSFYRIQVWGNRAEGNAIEFGKFSENS